MLHRSLLGKNSVVGTSEQWVPSGPLTMIWCLIMAFEAYFVVDQAWLRIKTPLRQRSIKKLLFPKYSSSMAKVYQLVKARRQPDLRLPPCALAGSSVALLRPYFIHERNCTFMLVHCTTHSGGWDKWTRKRGQGHDGLFIYEPGDDCL